MADLDKLIAQYGGSIVPEQKSEPSGGLESIATQFGGTVLPSAPTTPGGYGIGTFGKDIGKVTAAGAVPGLLGAPEAVESAVVQASKSGFTAPSDVLGYISSPDKLANKVATSLGFDPIFKDETKGIVPENLLKKQEQVVDEIRAKGKSNALKNLSEYGNKLGQDIRESASPEIQLAMANFVPTGSLDDLAKGKFENFSLGADPTALGFAGQFANVFGSIAPGMLGTIVTKDPKYMQVLGFGQAGSEGVSNARDYINSLDDNQLSNNSPYFQDLLRSGYDPQTARAMTIEKAVDTAATAQGVVGALGGDFTAKLITGKFDKALVNSVRNKALNAVAKTGKGAAIGATEEGFQEAFEGIASDLGIDKTVVKEIGADVFANFILGAFGGGGIGGVRGAIAKDQPEVVPPTPESSLTPVNVPPTAPVAPAGALIEPTQIAEPEVPVAAGVPVAPVAQTTGLPPETAREIELLQKQYTELEKRKADPTNTPLEQEINSELQSEITQKIEELVTTPVAPIAPEVVPEVAPIEPTPVAEGAAPVEAIDPELKARATMRVDQLITDAEQTGDMNVREINKLARELDVVPLADPIATASAILEKLSPSEQVSVAPVAEEVVTEPTEAPVEAAPEEAPEAPKQYNFGSGNIDAKVSQALPEEKYKEIYGTDGGILSFELEGPGVNSESGFKSVAGVTYEGKMTPERLEQMTAKVASMNSKPEEKVKPTKEEQIAINKARQAEKKAAAEKPSKEDVAEKKMLDAIESVKKDKGTANDFIAKHGKAMFERAKKEGYIDNEANDQRLFSTGKLDDLWIKYNQPERYAELMKKSEKTVVEMPEKEAEPTIQVTPNKIFTEDAAIKARNRLRSKLGQLNSGIDPEFLIDGITLSGYHIEKGARTFAAYAKAMIEDLGDKVKPYLKQWYNAVRDDPSAESLVDSMDSYEDVKKASLPDTTNNMMDLMDPEDKFDIAKLLATTMTGPNPNDYKSILDARAFISKLTGKKIEAGTAEAKEADEAIETAVVLAAKDIIDLNRRNGNDFRTYDDLVALYERQPNLSVRTSTSIKEQAYSTPAPLAYVASRLAGINQETTVYEPTAGNGMLLIAANPKKVIANELNRTRYEMLDRVLDGATINNRNAVELDINKYFDVVIANPPFGVVKDRDGKTISYNVKGLKTNEIDHAIAFKALANMTEDGRAVLIVGGVLGDSAEKRVDGYRSKSKREFYYNLYDKYNVVDHFTVAGDLYKKQGAAYPVDIIVIDGKGISRRKLPAADLPKVINSYEELKEKLNEPSRMESRPAGITRPDIGKGETRPSERGLLDTSAVVPSAAASEEGRKPAGGATEGVSAAETGVRTEREPSRADTGRKEPTAENVSSVQQLRQESVSSTSEGVEPRGAAVTGRGEPGGLGVSGSTVNERVRPPVKEEETQYQITYAPKSKLPSVETLMPKGMADAIRRSLDKLEEKVGDIDAYVAKSLEMDLNTLGKYFSAEQADALALAIDNAERGKGFIIGDQTGIGKGRVVAGMIKYAIVNGKIPIFVTEKPNLYADMMRDLNEIGMSDLLNLESDKQRVLITNSSSKDKIPYTFMKDENGKKVEKDYLLQSPKKGQAMNKLLDAMVADNDIGNYKVIFSTYDQMKTVKKGATTARREFLRHFANDNYVILDESHNAGGTGTPDPKKENVAKFARGLINNSYGSFFSSATYAKRPNVMDLYASTDMNLAVDNIADLAAAIQHGGVPMQQVVATMLAEAGQYIRREKSFEGISYETKEVSIDKDIAENMATTLRSVLSFSSSKESVIDAMQKDEDERGGILVGRDLVKSDVEGDNFGATMHNLIGQMLLSLKAEQAANYAIERLKKGEKVVLTVSSTMGSFLNEFAADMGIKKGDPVDLSFKDLFLKYLNKQRIVKIKNEFGEPPEFIDGVKEIYLTDDMLGPKLTKVFNDIKGQIESANYGSSPISPIDYMQSIIQKAGYKTAEITGRNLVIDYSTPALILDTRDSGIMERLKSINQFNNSDLNVMTLNRAGSTGLSLHASQNFKDQSKRHMIVVQADADIAVHFQMLGRVNRTGQTNKPAYTQLGGDIPAENRPMAVLAKKMASLNANTTAGQKSALTAENVVDFVNEYGGQVAQEFLADNPWFNETIGNRIRVSEDATNGTEEDIRKLTGYIPVFPIKQQEEIYQDLLDRYSSLIESVNSMGVNKLEAKAMDLDAKEVSSKQITEDKGEDSPFARPAFMEKIDVKRTVKPLTSKEVDELIVKNLDGRQPYEIARTLKSELRGKVAEYLSSKKKEMLEKEADPIRINQFEKQTELTESHVNAILDNYRIGESISIKNPEGGITYGVITDIFQKGKSVNPAAASAWKMQIALANGDSKSLTLSFSQIGNLTGFSLGHEDVVDYINLQTGQAQRMNIKQIFDAGSEERREKRWMVTGNLLSGFTEYPGQIVFYRKNDGSVAQGILMPRTFDFEKSEKEAPVKIKKAEDVIRFLTEVPYASVGSKDKVLRVAQRGGLYSFVVPRSKKVGGTYFSDDGLMKALGVQFTSRGSDMIANTWQEEKALAAFDYLINVRQEPLFATGALKEARELFRPPQVLEDIGGITQKEPETRRQEIRKEQIKRQAELSRGITKITKEIVKGNIGLNVQRQLTQLTKDKEAIKSEIAKTKEAKVSAEWFRTRASAENAAGNLTDATYAVVDTLAKRFPKMLDGLRLSVRSSKGMASGNFNPLERLLTVYNSGSVSQDRTMRHEIAHSLEQMMTPEAQIAIVESWADNLQKAIEKYTDLPHQEYFQAVLDFIEKPTESNFNKATNKIPEYEMYQYINPSEYWAVNAEKLMKASLGSPWARFVKGVQKIWEAIKSTLGMNNRYAVHQEFNRIMAGEQERITHKMLVQYVTDNANALRFLNNVEEFDKRFAEDGFANTPVKVSRHLKDRLLGGYAEAKHIYDRMKNNPLMATQSMGGKLVRAITYVRNKNVWFGAGLERAELISQKNAGLDGMLRDAEGKAVASIAVTNALHAGHIGSEVILRGSLGFNQQTQMFQAVRRDFSMANVLMYKHDLIERVGLQRATNMINKFFEAKRSKSILNDYAKRQRELADLEFEYAKPKTDETRLAALVNEILEAKKALKSIGIAKKKVNMNDEQIKFYGDLEKENPELRKMLDEWTQVNDNMIDMMLFSRIISKKRAEQLKGIKDYVPWYRIQDDMQDVHEPSAMGGVRGLSNVGKLKLFKDTETDLDIDDIVDNMLHNVMMITRNSMRNYAANRVAQEYATRNSKGQIAVFPKEGPVEATGAVRTNILANGRRIIVEIKDPLIAEAVIGMENIDMPAVKMLSALANGLRRGITLWPEFQLKQLFMDAPTAALVSGVKDPNKLWAGTFRGFIKALQADDPIVDMLKSYGIGGYQSYTRTPEKEYKQKIGLLEQNKFDSLMNTLDRIGDASDYAQRISIYNRVKAQTGDEMLALMQANNVIDFLKRGSGRTAQFLTKTVSFMNAYAQQIDVLAMTLVGGKLTGKSRAAALAQLAKTGAMFGLYATLYSMAVGGFDDYEELDDQTKLRNLVIPKELMRNIGIDKTLLIPMHTSASFFFKSIPELTYNVVTKEGTVNEMDATRIRKALSTAAVDSLLGPNPVPTGIKPAVEIALNRNFFTGGTVTPRGLEGLDAASQYNASTSELGKVISALTGNPFNEKRVLNPVEADHLVRSMFGTTGAALQWGSNLFSGERPTPRARDNPLFGSFIASDVGRAPEDLFYGLKEEVDGKYKTYMNFMNLGDFEAADKYFDKHEKEIVAHDYISSMDNALREINSQIRNIGKAKNDMTGEERRAEITYLQQQKNEMLNSIIEMRKEAGL